MLIIVITELNWFILKIKYVWLSTGRRVVMVACFWSIRQTVLTPIIVTLYSRHRVSPTLMATDHKKWIITFYYCSFIVESVALSDLMHSAEVSIEKSHLKLCR